MNNPESTKAPVYDGPLNFEEGDDLVYIEGEIELPEEQFSALSSIEDGKWAERTNNQ